MVFTPPIRPGIFIPLNVLEANTSLDISLGFQLTQGGMVSISPLLLDRQLGITTIHPVNSFYITNQIVAVSLFLGVASTLSFIYWKRKNTKIRPNSDHLNRTMTILESYDSIPLAKFLRLTSIEETEVVSLLQQLNKADDHLEYVLEGKQVRRRIISNRGIIDE